MVNAKAMSKPNRPRACQRTSDDKKYFTAWTNRRPVTRSKATGCSLIQPPAGGCDQRLQIDRYADDYAPGNQGRKGSQNHKTRTKQQSDQGQCGWNLRRAGPGNLWRLQFVQESLGSRRE